MPAMAVYQSLNKLTEHRYRRHASAHRWKVSGP